MGCDEMRWDGMVVLILRWDAMGWDGMVGYDRMTILMWCEMR